MSVYVDNGRYQFGTGARKMIMSHLIADTHEELIDMVEKIFVADKWIQKPGTKWEHFDIAQSKRKIAIELGAIQVTVRELAMKLESRDLEAYMKPSSLWPVADKRASEY